MSINNETYIYLVLQEDSEGEIIVKEAWRNEDDALDVADQLYEDQTVRFYDYYVQTAILRGYEKTTELD